MCEGWNVHFPESFSRRYFCFVNELSINYRIWELELSAHTWRLGDKERWKIMKLRQRDTLCTIIDFKNWRFNFLNLYFEDPRILRHESGANQQKFRASHNCTFFCILYLHKRSFELNSIQLVALILLFRALFRTFGISSELLDSPFC